MQTPERTGRSGTVGGAVAAVVVLLLAALGGAGGQANLGQSVPTPGMAVPGPLGSLAQELLAIRPQAEAATPEEVFAAAWAVLAERQQRWPTTGPSADALMLLQRNLAATEALHALPPRGQDAFVGWRAARIIADSHSPGPATVPMLTPQAAAAAVLGQAPLPSGVQATLDAVAASPEPLATAWHHLLATLAAWHTVVDRAPTEGLPERAAILGAAEAFHRAWEATPEALRPRGSHVVPPLFALDLDGHDTTHTEDVVLSIDVGGDDTYLNNAGGNAALAVAAAFDWDGADAYASNRSNGINGGGHTGAGVLIDLGGRDDVYLAGTAAVNGGGTTGSGLLVDDGGVDAYLAHAEHSNGGGGPRGRGVLVDLGDGPDAYLADGMASISSPRGGTNGGATGVGSGFLFDGGGSDTYRHRGRGADGGGRLHGVGFLADMGGDDVHDTRHFPSIHVTSGYGFGVLGGGLNGVGFYLDVAGDDVYRTGDTGAMGGAVGPFFLSPPAWYVAAGFAFDGGGNDTWWALPDPAYGSWAVAAHGLIGGAVGNNAEGFLWDGGGHDRYIAVTSGAVGGADEGRAMLIDLGGDDAYWAAGTSTLGGADGWYTGGLFRGPALALLLDAAGTDTYAGCVDCSMVPKGVLGAQVDLDPPTAR